MYQDIAGPYHQQGVGVEPVSDDDLQGGLQDPDMGDGMPDHWRALRLMERHYQANNCSTHIWNRGNKMELEVGRRQLIKVLDVDWVSRADYPSDWIYIAAKKSWNDPDHYWFRPTPEFIHFLNSRLTHFIRIPVEEKSQWVEKYHPKWKASWYSIHKRNADFFPLTGRQIPRQYIEYREPMKSGFKPETNN